MEGRARPSRRRMAERAATFAARIAIRWGWWRISAVSREGRRRGVKKAKGEETTCRRSGAHVGWEKKKKKKEIENRRGSEREGLCCYIAIVV